MNKNVEQILSDAIDVIETKGWTKGAAINQNEEVCTLGALDVAMRMGKIRQPDGFWGDYFQQAQDLVQAELVKANVGNFASEGVPRHAMSIPGMNDAPSTTKEDILLGLKHALHRARGE
jgi:hypothetical protein